MVMRTDQEGRRREGWRGHTVGVTRFGGLEVGYSKVLVYRRHPLDRISPPPRRGLPSSNERSESEMEAE